MSVRKPNPRNLQQKTANHGTAAAVPENRGSGVPRRTQAEFFGTRKQGETQAQRHGEQVVPRALPTAGRLKSKLLDTALQNRKNAENLAKNNERNKAATATASSSQKRKKSQPNNPVPSRKEIKRSVTAVQNPRSRATVAKNTESARASQQSFPQTAARSHSAQFRKRQRNMAQNVREKFGKDWDVVLQGTTKTRKISVRVIALCFTFLIAVIILANPVQGFLAQQEEKRALATQLAAGKDELEALQQQVDLWEDPSYVQAQARKRLGFVLPGQTLYYVSGDLTDAAAPEKVSDAERAIALRRKAMPFYLGIWKSIEIAGTADLSAEQLANPEHAPLVNEPAEKSENDPANAPVEAK